MTVSVPTAVALVPAPALVLHAGSLSGSLQSVPVPSWLVVLSGGGLIGASFLFTTLVTDHALIRELNDRRFGLPSPALLRAATRRAIRLLGVVGLALVVVSGLFGPENPVANLAVLLVWAGWWAGYTMSVYLVGDTWPALDPWRTLSGGVAWVGDRLGTGLPRVDYPERLGAWPSVAGLLALVLLEVVSPVAERPRVLAWVVVAYTVVTVLGAVAVGRDVWFDRVDPVARVFRFYGRLAPLQRTDRGVELTVPGGALTRANAPESSDDTAFVVALLWVTTFDGFVSTPAWRSLARPVVDAGVPALLVYALALVVGFTGFLVAYRLAARRARETAETYVSARFIAGWFVPSLLPIAAGYHLAHFLGYFLTLVPALAASLATPLAVAPDLRLLVLPGWFGTLQLGFVVLGHLVAVWVAHSLAFAVFAGRLQPIRSQYPFILVMVFYTMTSMWIVSQPYVAPPYV
ncbi:hypothetical protein [Halomarina litorea]|uniref:hypothetical protein n=1 Tax=Halomarina litorea TaxID=2961595 RepID=UPI0020C395F0|nr:hypothetical protein [Halomarina sp. BCD28]